MYGVACGFPVRDLVEGLDRAPSIAEWLYRTYKLVALHCNGGLIRTNTEGMVKWQVCETGIDGKDHHTLPRTF